jgi:dinuclear metal center YbgI/SA1388 family protein
MADRDEIVAFADALLELERYPDYGPMGLQVEGAREVGRIVCGVSASRELFEQAAARGAQLVLVHHGLFWRSEPQRVDRRMKGRLKTLFDHDLSLAAYHLALDAHPEIGNAALLARAVGVEPARAFAQHGVGGTLTEPCGIEALAERVRAELEREPLVFPFGPETVRTLAVLTGGGGRALLEAAREGYDAFLTGEPEEPALHDARELGVHFVAAGHYATERLGVQALARRLGERFGIEWEFVELPNPV